MIAPTGLPRISASGSAPGALPAQLCGDGPGGPVCVDCVEAYVPLRPPASNALCGSELTPAHQLLYHAEEIPRELAACKTLGMPSKHRASYYGFYSKASILSNYLVRY